MAGWFRVAKLSRWALLAVAFAGGPSFAQSNFAGVWAPNLFEDFPDRLPGPELGDYAGLPLNAADRMRAQSWSATSCRCPTISAESTRRTTPTVSPTFVFGTRSTRHAGVDRHPFSAFCVEHPTNDLDGRTAASAAIRPAHVDGLFYRRVGGADSQGDDYPFEGGLAPAQRCCSQRQRNGDGAFHSSCQSSHMERVRSGPEVSRGAFFPQSRLHDRRDRRHRRLSLRERRRSDPAGDYFPHYLPGQNPFLIEYARNHAIPAEAALGGAATMYPEYAKRLKELPQP